MDLLGVHDLVIALEQLGNVWQSVSGTIFLEWHRVQRYPALLVLFASGLAAVAAENLGILCDQPKIQMGQ